MHSQIKNGLAKRFHGFVMLKPARDFHEHPGVFRTIGRFARRDASASEQAADLPGDIEHHLFSGLLNAGGFVILGVVLTGIAGCAAPASEEPTDSATAPLAFWMHVQDGRTRLLAVTDSLQADLDELTSWFTPARPVSAHFTLPVVPQPVRGEVRVDHESAQVFVDILVGVQELFTSEGHACQVVMDMLVRHTLPGKGAVDPWGNDMRLKMLLAKVGQLPPDQLPEARKAARWLIDRTVFTAYLGQEGSQWVSCSRTGDGDLEYGRFPD